MSKVYYPPGDSKFKPDPEKTDAENLLQEINEARGPGERAVRTEVRGWYRNPGRKPQTRYLGRAARQQQSERMQGGSEGAQRSLDALAANRSKNWIHRDTMGTDNPTMCKKCGRQRRVQGSLYCRHHGGLPKLNARRAKHPLYRGKKTTVSRRGIRNLIAKKKIDRDMLNIPGFAALMNFAIRTPGYFLPKDKDWHDPERRAEAYELNLQLMHARRLLLNMVIGFDLLRDHGEREAWNSAFMRYREAGWLTAQTRPRWVAGE
ncbi:MAG: hypothetical protein AAGK37_19295 [Pseudomonadota bacterium]